MLQVDPKLRLPSSAELPCSDDTPVDNEDQNLLPNYLLFLLQRIWADRQDWFFAVDMAVYHTTGANPRVPVVPDAFLSIGVDRKKNGESRLSYVMWEENETPPILVIEMVSQTPGGEYDKKLEIYRKLGVLYYVIYNPKYWQRDRHQPFEVYQLVNDTYQLQLGEPFWMSEVGLGIGRREFVLGGFAQEGLRWFDQQATPYWDEGELLVQSQQQQAQMEQARQQAEQARQQAEQAQQQEQEIRQQVEQDKARLAAKLRSLGFDPNDL
ncbi:MAG: Uma2 family endonuclease [Synechococcales cyanobacterium RM1_1_8]|nr:Uma2 family endonuclease [Synechococcales cyanobacterium RM1_1_8]